MRFYIALGPQPVWETSWCQAKFLTSAKFLTC